MPEQEQEPPDSQTETPELAKKTAGRAWPSTVIVSLAAVAVTAMVGILGVINTWNSQSYEEAKSEREFRLGCVASAATIAKIAFDLSKDFKSLPDDEKINQVNIIIASFPPDAANRFLNALKPRMGDAQSVLVAFQVAQDNLMAKLVAEKRLVCESATQLIATNETTAQSPPVPPPPSSEPLTKPPTDAAGTSAVAPPALPGPAAVHRPITIYYQVTDPADLTYARMLARDVADAPPQSGSGTSFPSAGVELVSAARSLGQTEIRYYRLDQKQAAQDLLDQLLVEAKAKSLNLQVQPVYIGAKYPNLPAGRMEVWFQPLTRAHQG